MSHQPKPPTHLLHEAAITKIWSLQIWNNGMIKIYHDPRRGLSSSFTANLGEDGTIKITYKQGALHSRQIPAFVRKYAARAATHLSLS